MLPMGRGGCRVPAPAPPALSRTALGAGGAPLAGAQDASRDRWNLCPSQGLSSQHPHYGHPAGSPSWGCREEQPGSRAGGISASMGMCIHHPPFVEARRAPFSPPASGAAASLLQKGWMEAAAGAGSGHGAGLDASPALPGPSQPPVRGPTLPPRGSPRTVSPASPSSLNLTNSDILTVYDGDELTARILGQFVGSSGPQKLYSSSPDLTIQFHSDPAGLVFGKGQGFIMNYIGTESGALGVSLPLLCRWGPGHGPGCSGAGLQSRESCDFSTSHRALQTPQPCCRSQGQPLLGCPLFHAGKKAEAVLVPISPGLAQ